MLNTPLRLLDGQHSILVFGCDGQVGKALKEQLLGSAWPVIFLGRSNCDLADQIALEKILRRYQPSIIINAAAHTAVDLAESEPELVWAVNAKAPELMAHHIAHQAHGVLIHYSADYVFGDTQAEPYVETDVPGPMHQLNRYGQSKLAGEQMIAEVFDMASQKTSLDEHEKPRYLILRTSWAYGCGNNFISSIVDQSFSHHEIKVVADQVGVPTSSVWLAQIGLRLMAAKSLSGIFHVVPDGEVSRYELAHFVVKLLQIMGSGNTLSLDKVIPVKTKDYSSPAQRPLNSRMKNIKLKNALFELGCHERFPSWQEPVIAYVTQYVKSSIHNKLSNDGDAL